MNSWMNFEGGFFHTWCFSVSLFATLEKDSRQIRLKATFGKMASCHVSFIRDILVWERRELSAIFIKCVSPV